MLNYSILEYAILIRFSYSLFSKTLNYNILECAFLIRFSGNAQATMPIKNPSKDMKMKIEIYARVPITQYGVLYPLIKINVNFYWNWK